MWLPHPEQETLPVVPAQPVQIHTWSCPDGTSSKLSEDAWPHSLTNWRERKTMHHESIFLGALSLDTANKTKVIRENYLQKVTSNNPIQVATYFILRHAVLKNMQTEIYTWKVVIQPTFLIRIIWNEKSSTKGIHAKKVTIVHMPCVQQHWHVKYFTNLQLYH